MPSSEVMHKWKHGDLHSGSKRGPVVRKQKQAVAILLSEKRAEKKHGGKYPEKKKSLVGELWLYKAGDSMTRKRVATHEILTHHGYTRNPGWASRARSGDSERHESTYHHPSGHTVNARHDTGSHLKGSDLASVRTSHIDPKGKISTKFKRQPNTLHKLDADLSNIHGTNPKYPKSAKFKSFAKSLCSICHGAGMVTVVFKSDGQERRNDRPCPICNRGME